MALADCVPFCPKGVPGQRLTVSTTFPSWQSGLLDPQVVANGLRFSWVLLALNHRGFLCGAPQEVSTADVRERGATAYQGGRGCEAGPPALHPALSSRLLQSMARKGG